MTITALPVPPSRQDPINFSERADAFMGALPAFATETNATAVDVDADAASAAASAVNAAASAAGANASANVSKWVSGTTYAEGDVEWSPVNFFSYRRKVAGAGTTDPSADPTNWALVSGAGDVSLTGIQTLTNKTLIAPEIGTPISGDLANCTFPNSIARVSSPSFTGSPTAPTATAGNNSTLLATTAFVIANNPQASETVAGKVELATTAETNTGTDSTRVVTPLGLSTLLNLVRLGANQTWQNVAASRVFGTTYTNSTTRPIFVSITQNASTACSLFVSGVVAAYTGQVAPVQAIVPAGGTYAVTSSSTILYWAELR